MSSMEVCGIVGAMTSIGVGFFFGIASGGSVGVVTCGVAGLGLDGATHTSSQLQNCYPDEKLQSLLLGGPWPGGNG